MLTVVLIVVAVGLWSRGRHFWAAGCAFAATTRIWPSTPRVTEFWLLRLLELRPIADLMPVIVVVGMPMLVIAWLNGWRPKSSGARPPRRVGRWARTQLARTVVTPPDPSSDQPANRPAS